MGNGLIVLDKVTIAANGYDKADSIASNGLYNISVIGANDEATLLGNLIDAKKWDTITGGFTYGRKYTDTNLISISGGLLATSVDAATLNTANAINGSVFTFNKDWIADGLGEVSIKVSDDYSVTLSASSETATAGWVTLSGTSASWKKDGSTDFSLKAGSGDVSSIISVTDGRDAVVTVSGLADLTDASLVGFGFTTNKVTVADSLFGASGQISVYGAADTTNYTFDFSAATKAANVAAGSSSINILGGSGKDSLYVGTGLSNISVFGGAEADTINIASASGSITVNGGEGNDLFIFANSAKASIQGLEVGDTIQVGDVSKASVSADGVLVIGASNAVSLGVNGFDSISDYNPIYNVVVKSASASSILGDLIDPKEWASVAAGTFTWGRDYGSDRNLISISGGSGSWNSSITADAFKKFTDSLSASSAMNGDTLTVDVGWLGKEDILFTTSGTGVVTLSATETVRTGEAEEWATIGANEVIYKDSGNFAYSITAAEAAGGVSTIDAVDQRDILVTISGAGLASSVSGADTEFVFDDGVASLGAAAFNTSGGAISVFGAADSVNYTFNFSAASDANIGGASASLGANIVAGTSSITILGSDYADTIGIGTGLQNISVFGGDGADTIYVTAGNNITVDGGNGANVFNISGGGTIQAAGGESSDIFNISDTANNISIGSASNDSDTFAFNLTNGANITIKGLDTSDVISLSNTIASGSVIDGGKLVLGNATITANELTTAAGFASLYSVKVYNGTGADSETTLGNLIDTIGWHEVTADNTANYGRTYGADSATIVISGLASLTSQVATLNAGEYISGGTTLLTFDSDVLKGQTTPITLTSSMYHAALASDTKVVYNPESYSTLSTTSVAYKSANTVAGYEITARTGDSISDTINYVAAASSEATIAGLATNFNLKNIAFGENVFTISAAALTTTNVTLTGEEAYQLTVGADVSGQTVRSEYWLADSSTATFYAGQGTVAGHDVAEGGKSIVYTPEANGTETIVIKGLKGIASDGKSIGGITLDSTTSSVTIAKTIIGTVGAGVTVGSGYNYTLGGKAALISSVEKGGVTLTGSTSNDSLTNNGGASYLDGGKGNDVIVAGANGDTISAGVGNDSISLGAGKDSVYYSGGND